LAAAQGHTEVIELLVDQYGVDPGIQSMDGESPIIVATKLGQHEVVELLKSKYQQPEPSPADLEKLK